MKVTKLWVYPIKALRGISLEEADLTAQGIRHDRSFMLCRISETGELAKLQMASNPQCALFSQDILPGDDGEKRQLRVRYHRPAEPVVPLDAKQDEELTVPLEPDVAGLEVVDMNLHQAWTKAYRMGGACDAWFSACFGFPTTLLYIGANRRPILGTFSPKARAPQPAPGITSWLSSYVWGGGQEDAPEEDWLTFSDCAPFLVASDSSLDAFRAKLAQPSPGDGADPEDSTLAAAQMYKFRPNIVVAGAEPWQEDFWSTLTLRGAPAFVLSKMCNRCTSLNVDYDAGRYGEGGKGHVLKMLSRDRRVDPGSKYSPVFGRYAFLHDGAEGGTIALGDEVGVGGLADERPVWDWPLKDKSVAKWYGQQPQAQRA
ncbi:hypothetical protein N3K66_002141 [Trichothecium roseum]|uniref:Uncharacterized protein n=1 Tax=Trichothecium roseum TaxID=47278 RepID=A0ACC0V998_9HYPO|nr:hypothetical protein N3K66_002141 [Trichothecium roseum]